MTSSVGLYEEGRLIRVWRKTKGLNMDRTSTGLRGVMTVLVGSCSDPCCFVTFSSCCLFQRFFPSHHTLVVLPHPFPASFPCHSFFLFFNYILSVLGGVLHCSNLMLLEIYFCHFHTPQLFIGRPLTIL